MTESLAMRGTATDGTAGVHDTDSDGTSRQVPPLPVQDRRRELAARLAARAKRPGPLAAAQVRLFTLWQMQPASSAYHESVVLRLRGRLDADLLLSCVRSLAERHEWLRSRVDPNAGDPVQVVDSQLVPDVELVDLSMTSGRGRLLTGQAREWVDAVTSTPFDLEHGPVWRAGLGRLADDDHVLVLVVHHVACDATSLAVLLDELEERYEAGCCGAALTLPAASSPRDVSERLRLRQQGDDVQQALAEHVSRLSGAPLHTRVTAGSGAPAGAGTPARAAAPAGAPAGAAAVRSRRLPATLVERVHRVAERLSVSPFSLVTTALAAATSRTVGTDDLVVGVPLDLRPQLSAGEDTVAFLIETLALRLKGLPSRTLADLSAEVRDVTADALERPVPFDAVVEALRRAGELAPTGEPLHVYVNWLDGRESRTLGAQGPVVSHVDVPLGDAKFDLSWTAISSGSQLAIRLEFDSARLDVQGADRLLDRVVHILDVATASPASALGELGLLDPTEAAEITALEGTVGDEPGDDLMTFVLNGLGDASRVAVQEVSQAALTVEQLRASVDRLAASLIAAGVRPGDRVAVSGRRCVAMVVGLLAVLRAGGAFVPVDERHPASRQELMAAHAGVRAVLGATGWAKPLAERLGVVAVCVDSGGTPLQTADAQLPARWPQRSAGSTAYVMYTSGSTGTPKGVRVSDGAVVARSTSYRSVLSDQPVRFLLQSALGFDASIYLFWALASGGCLVVPPDDSAADPGALARAIRRHHVTDCFFVPSFYTAVLEAAPAGSLRSLQRVCVGGEVFPPPLAAQHATAAPGATLLNVCGPTEAVVTSTSAVVDPAQVADVVPIGRPHVGTSARVLDASGHPVAVGAPGELHLGGPCIAHGYDSEARRPLSHPFSLRSGDQGRQVRWYATGDVVYRRQDGDLVFVGRRDRQVKVRGQRIELAELEAALRRATGVEDAAVEVLTDHAVPRLVAVVAPSADGVLEEVRRHLPPAWVPERLVAVPALPTTPGGKVDRAAVRRLAAAAPEDAHRAISPAGLPRSVGRAHTPSTESMTERAVLSVVRDLLADPDVGLDDDFFETGGNSLLAARLVGVLHGQMGATIQLHELAVRPTARGIAATLDPTLSSMLAAREQPRIVALRESGHKAPLVIAARDGDASLFLRHVLRDLDPERPLWMLLRPMPPVGFTVPDLVADGRAAAAALLSHFADGPIHLVGHSASGIVALETARELGERRGVTVMLDTMCPPRWTQTAVASLLHSLRVALAHARLVRRRQHPWGRRAWTPDARLPQDLRLYQDGQANHRVRLRPAEFPVALVTVAASRESTGCDDLGWAGWCSDLSLLPLGGDHLSMLLHPDVQQTVAAIGEALATAP